MLKPKILIVDDSSGLDNFFAEFLKNDGFDASVATTYGEAIEILNSVKLDLLIADISKIANFQELTKTAASRNVLTIWASRFDNIDPVDLPDLPRILNKPFRTVDVITAIKSEFSKAKLRFDTI